MKAFLWGIKDPAFRYQKFTSMSFVARRLCNAGPQQAQRARRRIRVNSMRFYFAICVMSIVKTDMEFSVINQYVLKHHACL